MEKKFIDDVLEGDVLGQAITTENGVVLMYEGVELRSYHIDKLRENQIREVYIKEVYGDKIVPSYTIEEIAHESVENVKEIIERNIRTQDSQELQQITDVATGIINDVISNPDIAYCVINVRRERSDLYTHLINVATLSTIIAVKFGLGQNQVRDVARGAILHDIGLSGIGLDYDGIDMDTMPAAEKLAYRKHVINGYERVKDFDWINETVKDIVLLHHERNDGSGYPFHKKGKSIPFEVKIVSVCDHFDELVNGIAHDKNKVSDVVEFFRTSGIHIFDYDIINMLLTNVAWFPTDSKVLTNEGDIALVFKQNKSFPDRPVLRVIETKDGKKFDSELIIKDLTEDLTCFIADIID